MNMTYEQKPAYRRVLEYIFQPLDSWLFLAMLVIYLMSLALLYSADGQDLGQLQNKSFHTVIGFIIIWIVAKSRPHFVANFAMPAYVVSLTLLVLVHFVGITVNGSTRWLNLGIIRIQPSEIMKIALPMTLAWYFQKHELDRRWYHYLVALGIILAPFYLVFKQPDLGTALLIFASGVFVLFFAGLSWKVIWSFAILAVMAAPLLWKFFLHDYQRLRILMLLDPTKDRLGSGYHIIQSMIAIGSGGIWGKGWLNGTQTHLNYIPESTTDFIFAVYGEEFGLIGNTLLLLIYLVIIGRGFYISIKARTLYGRLLTSSLTMIIFCYAFVNMGMVSGILPVVGVPLPLVSYGGTATLSIMTIIALMMSVRNHSK